jgi:hypothetical protein
MNHTTLTAEQYTPVIAKLMAHRDYLGKLKDRMHANRFPGRRPAVRGHHEGVGGGVRRVRGRVHVPEPRARATNHVGHRP